MSTKTSYISSSHDKKLDRIAAFDLARGVPILFMIIIHVLAFYGSADVQQGNFAKTVNYLIGWPSASIFVFMMGVFVVYSTNSNLNKGLQRAATLFMLGYLLNLVRETIPTWLSLELGFVTSEQLGMYTPLHGLLVVDILQNAGLAYAICLLLKHYIKQAAAWLALALLVAFGSPLLWDITTGIPVFDQLLKIFWGNRAQGALFPLFPWLAYPLVGMAFGQWFKHSTNNKKAFNITLLAGISLLIVGRLIIELNPEYHIADKMRHGPGLLVLMTGIVFIWLWLFNLLTLIIKPNIGFSLLYFWSKHVTAMYFIHWLFVGWGLMLFGAEQLALPALLLWMLTVAISSDATLRLWLKKKKKNTQSASSLNIKQC